MRAASSVESVPLLWHKVAHFGTVDESCQGAVKFSHLLCFRRADALPMQLAPEAAAAAGTADFVLIVTAQ